MTATFINIPCPAANGSGAAVDISALGLTKTFVASDLGVGSVTIEINNATLSTDGTWAPLIGFVSSGAQVIPAAARWVRATVTGYKSGTPRIDVGASDAGATFAILPSPPSVGSGAAVDTSAMAASKTVTVGNNFTGQVVIEISTDGTSHWAPVVAFSSPGQKSFVATADWMRVTRTKPGLGTTPVVAVGASVDSADGIIVEDEGVFELVAEKLNFVGAGVTASDGGGGVATINIPGGISGVAVQDEGVPVVTTGTLNFVGAGITATNIAGVGTISVPGGVTIQDEGIAVLNNPHSTLNFIGAGVTAADAGGGVVSITIPGLAVQDEGIAVVTTTAMNFVGSNVAATNVAGVATVTIGNVVPGTFSFSTTHVVLGRDTAGAGVGEEVTASQLLDWVTNTNGVLLTRTAGSWAAVGSVSVDNGELVLADDSAVVAPSAGTKIYSRSLASRSMLAFINPNDKRTVQPLLGRSRVGWWGQASATTFTALGTTGVSIGAGTGTSRPPASTNLCTSARRVGLVSATTANATAWLGSSTYNWVWRGNAAGLGGFFQIYKFAISDAVLVTTANMFMGLSATNYTDVAPSTVANRIGVGVDSGDTTLQLYASGAAAQARTALVVDTGPNAGGSYPANTVSTDIYELILYAPPNAADIQWRLERINTGDVSTGDITAAAKLPANTTFMTPIFGRSTGTSGTGSAVAFDFFSAYFESDN